MEEREVFRAVGKLTAKRLSHSSPPCPPGLLPRPRLMERHYDTSSLQHVN